MLRCRLAAQQIKQACSLGTCVHIQSSRTVPRTAPSCPYPAKNAPPTPRATGTRLSGVNTVSRKVCVRPPFSVSIFLMSVTAEPRSSALHIRVFWRRTSVAFRRVTARSLLNDKRGNAFGQLVQIGSCIGTPSSATYRLAHDAASRAYKDSTADLRVAMQCSAVSKCSCESHGRQNRGPRRRPVRIAFV